MHLVLAEKARPHRVPEARPDPDEAERCSPDQCPPPRRAPDVGALIGLVIVVVAVALLLIWP